MLLLAEEFGQQVAVCWEEGAVVDDGEIAAQIFEGGREDPAGLAGVITTSQAGQQLACAQIDPHWGGDHPGLITGPRIRHIPRGQRSANTRIDNQAGFFGQLPHRRTDGVLARVEAAAR